MNSQANDRKILSVTDLNNYIKILFDNTITLQNIYIHGEISNFTGINRSGHLYFSLNDETCSIKAVMFRFDATTLTFVPKNGDEVIVFGTISSYPPNGTYQIIVKKIELFGLGDILLKKQQLKEKLYKEGYFNESHKKQLPKYPKRIGIISGKNSAGLVDIITNINRRFPIVEISVYYSLVQGVNAVNDIIKSLNKAENDDLDVLIIGRGGGSSEDLSCFDDEMLVKELYKCKIPIISAIGHEINQSLCDLVADKYASTPTGAAEFAVPDKKDLLEMLSQDKQYLNSKISQFLSNFDMQLSLRSSNKYLSNISFRYDEYQNLIKNKEKDLNTLVNEYISDLQHIVNSKRDFVLNINPEKILEKGYSIVFNTNGVVISSSLEVQKDDKIKITTKKGDYYAVVEEK
jgi:exodeoxyribonuclease VII, large subunit